VADESLLFVVSSFARGRSLWRARWIERFNDDEHEDGDRRRPRRRGFSSRQRPQTHDRVSKALVARASAYYGRSAKRERLVGDLWRGVPSRGKLEGQQLQPWQIAQLAYNAGWRETKSLVRAVAICFAESDGFVRAHNDNLDDQGKVLSGMWGCGRSTFPPTRSARRRRRTCMTRSRTPGQPSGCSTPGVSAVGGVQQQRLPPRRVHLPGFARGDELSGPRLEGGADVA
jgi:hypothetical protein